jgi:hypothetical protein
MLTRVASLVGAVLALVGCSSSSGPGNGNHANPPTAADCTEPTPGPTPRGWSLITLGSTGSPWWACGPTSVFAASGGAVIRPLGPFPWQHDSTGLTTVNAIWGSSSHDIYAVGAGIAHFNGTNWTVQYIATQQLNAVWGTSSSDIYVVGQNVVLHSTGNGQWTTAYFAQFNATSVNGSGAGDVWVVGSATGGTTSLILHGSASSGFTPDLASTRFAPLRAVWAASTTEAVAGGPGELLRYDGHQWTAQQTSDTLTALAGFPTNAIVYGLFTSSAIQEYNGTAWSTIVPPNTQHALTTITAAGSVVYAAGDTVFEIGSGGLAASSVVPGAPYNGIWLSAPGTGWVVGDFGAMLQGTNGIWKPVLPVTAAYLQSVWGSSASDIYAVGQNVTSGGNSGTIIHYNGTTWSIDVPSVPNPLTTVYGTSAGDVWAVGQQGTIMHNTSGSWTTVASPVTVNLSGIGSAPGQSDVWVVGDSATILHYANGSWTVVQHDLPGILAAVWFDSPSNAWAVGYTNGDTTCYRGSNFQLICNPGPGLFEHYDGTSWTTVSVPQNAPNAIWGLGNEFWTGGATPAVYGEGQAPLVGNFTGSSWVSDTTMDPLFAHTATVGAIYGTSAQDIFALSSMGLLHYSAQGIVASRGSRLH